MINFLLDHKIIAPFLFILIRSTSVIFPPIPGIAFDIVGITVFGPFLGFLYGETGTMLGASVAFFISRIFKKPASKRIKLLEKLEEWQKTISEKKKFWSLVFLRIPTNSLFDYISYAAGLTSMKFSKFFFSTLLGSLPSMLFVYLLGGFSFRQGLFSTILFFALIILLWILFCKKGIINKRSKIIKI